MLIGLLLVGLAAISWGTTGATMMLLARDTGMGPLLVGWARLAVAAPCLLLASVATDLVAAPSRRPARAPREISSYVALGLAMAAYQVCYFWAVALTGVAVAALLAICSAPVLIAILAALLLKERPTRSVWLSLGMAVVGTALLVVGPRGLGPVSGRFGLGVTLALGAGVSYAVYAVAAKAVLSRVAPVRVAAMTFTLGAIFLAPALWAERASLGLLVAGWPLILYLGAGPTAAAYVLFTVGLKRVPATMAGIASLLEPLTATVLGVVAFGESLGTPGFAGALLLLAALALLATRGQAVTARPRSRGSRRG